MMDRETLIEVTEKALNQTKSGRLKWSMFHRDDNKFQVNFKRSSLFIEFQNLRQNIKFSVINSKGVSIGEIFSNEEKARFGTERIKELFYLVRRKTLEIDETIKDVFDSLNGDKMSE